MPTPLSVTPQYFLNGAWVTAPVYAEDGPVVIERGYTDEGTIRPTSVKMRINDAADPSLNPSRPTSALYGITGRSLPIQVLGPAASVRGVVDVYGMDPDETQDFSAAAGRGLRWLDIEAYGPLYRVGQWSDELQSTMTRTFLQYSTLTGFWPGEDAGLSTRVGIGRNATGFTFADLSAPPGASGSFLGTTTSRAVFSPNIASTSAGFQVFFSVKLSAIPVSPATTQFISWRANNILYSLEIDNIALHFKTFINGTLVDDSNTALVGIDTGWISWRAKCYQSGGNIVTELAWFSATTGVLGITRTNPGTIDRLTSIRIDGNALVNGTRYTEIGSLTTVADDLQSLAVLQSFVGFAGETTVQRFNRVLTEAGVAHSVLGTSTTLMGAQKAQKLFDLLKEIAATEDGLIYDARSGSVITMRTRLSRMNQTVAFTATYAGEVVPPFKERLDNVGVQNTITVEDRTGAVGTAVKTAGPMSANAYPAGIGVFKGGAFPDVDVNLFDPASQLPAFAAWLLARGTVPGPRFPTVSFEVGLKSPAFQAVVAAVNIGDRIQITGRLPDTIDLQVIGVTEKIGTHTWDFTFTCIPHDVFNVGVEDSLVHLLDARASTIITAPSPATTGTSMVVGSVDPDDVWSTTSLPYAIRVSGERMQVTAATAPALVSGTWRQTLTVTRSVNGVVKTQVAGTAVNVFQPIREAY